MDLLQALALSDNSLGSRSCHAWLGKPEDAQAAMKLVYQHALDLKSPPTSDVSNLTVEGTLHGHQPCTISPCLNSDHLVCVTRPRLKSRRGSTTCIHGHTKTRPDSGILTCRVCSSISQRLSRLNKRGPPKLNGRPRLFLCTHGPDEQGLDYKGRPICLECRNVRRRAGYARRRDGVQAVRALA